MDQKSTSMSSRRSETTAAMPSVTVGMLVIAVTGSARHVATQWAMREGGAGRQQAGRSARPAHLHMLPEALAAAPRAHLLERSIEALRPLTVRHRILILSRRTRVEHRL